MGLFMYIDKRVNKYVKDDGTLSNDLNDLNWNEYDCSNAITIISHAVAWEKANMIHKWFVDNVQNGMDDGGEYEVSIDELNKLRKLCLKIIYALDGEKIKVPNEFVDKFNKTYGNEKEYTQIVKITKDNFKELKLTGYHKLTKKQIAKIDGILPTQFGFYFGNTEYNGMYLDDIIDTIKKLDYVIKDSKNKDGIYENRYFYHASW